MNLLKNKKWRNRATVQDCAESCFGNKILLPKCVLKIKKKINHLNKKRCNRTGVFKLRSDFVIVPPAWLVRNLGSSH